VEAASGLGKRSNWLLRGLIAVSIAVHAVVFVHVAGIYDARDRDYIELTLQNEAEPATRSIPRPPQRNRQPPQTDVAQPSPLRPQLVKPPPAPPAPESFKAPNPSLVEPIAVPERPAMSKPGAVAWSMPKSVPGGAGAYGSSEDYFGMVRMKIEGNKKYPVVARKRQVEGRVKVRFVIESDGTVSDLVLSEGSRHAMLDEAALEAVRASAPFPPPPRRLFSGPVSLEVSILFELM